MENSRFKFRVWSKKYKMYVEDNHYPIGSDYSLSMTPNGYVEVIGMGDYDDDGAFSWGTIDSLKDSAGDCIVEQCTGLKDRDQKLIYEGDILDFDLSTPKNGGHYRGFIRWQQQNNLIGWMISDMDMAGDWDLRQIAHPNDWMVWGEIIGNIHENRELLEFNPEDYDIEI